MSSGGFAGSGAGAGATGTGAGPAAAVAVALACGIFPLTRGRISTAVGEAGGVDTGVAVIFRKAASGDTEAPPSI